MRSVRFAIKVGIGAALYALFAFIPLTRPIYQHWRGEWGLLSYMLVCSMTIGASNTTGSARFIGTFIGAAIAVIIWASCQGNPFALAFCGWVVSLPCFYIIIAKGKGPFGRFISTSYSFPSLMFIFMGLCYREPRSESMLTATLLPRDSSQNPNPLLNFQQCTH